MSRFVALSGLPEATDIDGNIYLVGIVTSGVRPKVRRLKTSRLKAFFGAANSAVRDSISYTTPEIPRNGTFEGTIAIARSAILYQCQFDYPAWLRLYDDSVALIADRNRAININPNNNGVLIEEISSASQLMNAIPDILIVNKGNSPNISFPFSLTNLGQSSKPINFTLNYLILEA